MPNPVERERDSGRLPSLMNWHRDAMLSSPVDWCADLTCVALAFGRSMSGRLVDDNPAMESVREWIAMHPPPDERFTQTLASVAERVHNGEDLRFAVRELLDEFALRGRDDLRVRAIAEEPRSVDPHVDAYLGALGEHLARTHRLPIPAWRSTSDARSTTCGSRASRAASARRRCASRPRRSGGAASSSHAVR